MSNLRIFWIIWCSFWALFWLFSWWFTFGIGLLGVPISLLAILIPIGADPNRAYTTEQVEEHYRQKGKE